MTTRENFAKKYRPRRFEDVRGQSHPVAFLSEAIKQGQRGYDLLIHGQVGSGKTSLVRLYEMALNCEQPTVTGSPCLDCATCKKPRQEVGLREYDVSGRGSKDFEDWFSWNYQTPTDYRWQVLFLDEAHSLDKEDSDSLLKRIEDRTQERVIVCLATTEFDSIRSALRSRLMKLEVRPLSPAESISMLREVAEEEGIEFEPEGLALLAGIAGNQPRDLLNELEVIAVSRKKLTEPYVREFLDVDHKPGLLAYFRALANGDLKAEILALENWREARTDQAKWISAFLLALYYNNIQKTDLIVEPITHSIQTERADLLRRFQARFNVGDVAGLAPYWRGMLRFWAERMPADDVSAQLQLMVFRSLVVETPHELLERQPEERSRSGGEPVKEVHEVADIEWQDTSEYLTPAGACTIIDLGSLLVQEYGVGFNAALEIRAVDGRVDEGILRRETEEFVGRLGTQFAEPTADAFAYLALLERDNGDPRALIVAHLPKRKSESFDDWTGRVRRVVEELEPKGFGTTVTLTEQRAMASKIDWSFHWKQTLNLCLGVADPSGNAIPFSKLKIREGNRRTPGPICGGLLLRSRRLSEAAINQMSDEGLAPFRPAKEDAWGYVLTKWELGEYEQRKRLRDERDAKLQPLEAAYRDNVDGMNRARDEALNEWRDRVRDRARPWSPKA